MAENVIDLKSIPCEQAHTSVNWSMRKYSASIEITVADIRKVMSYMWSDASSSATIPFRGGDKSAEEWRADIKVEGQNVDIKFHHRPYTPSNILEGEAILTFTDRPMKTVKSRVGRVIGASYGSSELCHIQHQSSNEEEFKISFRAVYEKFHSVSEVRPSVYLQDGFSDLSSTLEQFFLSGKESDISFVIGNVNVPAHKAILRARVPYFDKMLSSGMVETKTNTVVIKDSDAASFKDVLIFIYSGKLPKKLEEKSFQILPLADKYDLQSLKDACIHCMDVGLTQENVCDTLITADLYRCGVLKKKCLMSLNEWRESLDRKVFEQLQAYPALMIDLIKIR